MSQKNPVRIKRRAALGANKSWQSLMKEKTTGSPQPSPDPENMGDKRTQSNILSSQTSSTKSKADYVENKKRASANGKLTVQNKSRPQPKTKVNKAGSAQPKTKEGNFNKASRTQPTPKENSFNKGRRGRKNLQDQLLDNSKSFNENVTSISGSYFCKNCEFVTTQILLMKSHLKNCQTKKKRKKRSSVQKCMQCDVDFPSTADLKEHFIQTHQEKRYRCTKCESEFETRNSFTKHIKKVHLKESKASETANELVVEKEIGFQKHWKKNACSNFENESRFESRRDSGISLPLEQNEVSHFSDQPVLSSGDQNSDTNTSDVPAEQAKLSDGEISLLKTQFLQHSQLLLTQFMSGNDTVACRTMIEEIEHSAGVLNVGPVAGEIKKEMNKWEVLKESHSNDKLLAANFTSQSTVVLFSELVPNFTAIETDENCQKNNNKGVWLKSEDHLLKIALQKLSAKGEKLSKKEQARRISSSLTGKTVNQIWNRLRNMKKPKQKIRESQPNGPEESDLIKNNEGHKNREEVDMNINSAMQNVVEVIDLNKNMNMQNDTEEKDFNENEIMENYVDEPKKRMNGNNAPMDISMHLDPSDPYLKKNSPRKGQGQSVPMLRWSKCSLDEVSIVDGDLRHGACGPVIQQPHKEDAPSTSSREVQLFSIDHGLAKEGSRENRCETLKYTDGNHCAGEKREDVFENCGNEEDAGENHSSKKESVGENHYVKDDGTVEDHCGTQERTGEDHCGTQERTGEKHSGTQESTGEKHSGTQERTGEKHSGTQERTGEKHSGTQERTGEKHSGTQERTGEKHSGTQERTGENHSDTQERTGEKHSGTQERTGENHSGTQERTGEKHCGTQERTGLKHSGIQERTGEKQSGIQERTSEKHSSKENGFTFIDNVNDLSEYELTFGRENSETKLSPFNDSGSLSFLRQTINILNDKEICQICTLEVTDQIKTICCEKVCCSFCLEVLTDIYSNICPLCNKTRGMRKKLLNRPHQSKVVAPSTIISQTSVGCTNNVSADTITRPFQCFRPWLETSTCVKDASLKETCVTPSSISQNVTSTAPSSFQNLKSVAPSINQKVPCTAPSMGQNLTCTAPSIGQNLTSTAPSIGQNLTSTAPSIGQNLTCTAPSIGQKVTCTVPSISQKSIHFGGNYNNQHLHSSHFLGGYPWYHTIGSNKVIDFESKSGDTNHSSMTEIFHSMERSSGGLGHFKSSSTGDHDMDGASSVMEHLKEGDVETQSDKKLDVKETSVINDEQCDDKTNSTNNMNHKNGSKKLLCLKCGSTGFRDSYNLKRHDDQMHSVLNILCKKCDVVFVDRQSFMCHDKNCYYFCKALNCSFMTKKETRMNTHARTHKTDKQRG